MNALRVFVASSSEQVETARDVAKALTDGEHLVAHPWTEETFNFSDTYIESLEKELDRADFGVVVLTASDSATVRDETVNLPRDNVIFELGLFMGRLGRERCFFLVDDDSDTKIASDLTGVKPVSFSRRADGAADRSMEHAVQALRQQMLTLSPRRKLHRRARETQEELWRFSARMEGHYWERMRSGDTADSKGDESRDDVALSYVTVTLDDSTGMPRMNGKAFRPNRKPYGEWHSLTSALILGDRPRVLYYWEGTRETAPGQTFGGGGYIDFDDQELLTAEAYHYDTNFALIKEGAPTQIRRHGIYRCDPADVEVMTRPWTDEAERLVAKRLESLRGR